MNQCICDAYGGCPQGCLQCRTCGGDVLVLADDRPDETVFGPPSHLEAPHDHPHQGGQNPPEPGWPHDHAHYHPGDWDSSGMHSHRHRHPQPPGKKGAG